MQASIGRSADERRSDRVRGIVATLAIALILVMTSSVVGAFFLTRSYTNQMEDLRMSMREFRTTRHYVLETEQSVLNGLSRPDQRINSMNYVEALARLDQQPESTYPPIMLVNGKSVPSSELLEKLRSSWSRIVAALENGQGDIARTIYASDNVNSVVQSVTATFRAELDAGEAQYSALQHKLSYASNAVTALQLLTGLICVAAFLFATIAGKRQSVERWRTLADANRQREKIVRLSEMTDMLQSANDHTDSNTVLRATATELMPDFGGALYVFNNSRDRLILSADWNLPAGHKLPDAIGLSHCWALKRGKRHINRPNAGHLCCDHDIGVYDTLEIPMIARGEILGLFQVYAPAGSAPEAIERITETATAIADAMSLALANIALRELLRSQALRDPLTGLYNRRYMEDSLQRSVLIASRENTPLSVIMLDLDHFKHLNDQFGHAKGDAVLRDAAAVLTNRLRESDVACRYGGEEMIIVMPGCDMDAAAKKAELLRIGIEALSGPSGAPVSASFGVATLAAGSNSVGDLVASADAALYRAKKEGRNRVVTNAMSAVSAPPLSEDNPQPLTARPKTRRKRLQKI
jgi:diguanylate cyclase (GGDEF)-like protein